MNCLKGLVDFWGKVAYFRDKRMNIRVLENIDYIYCKHLTPKHALVNQLVWYVKSFVFST